MSGSWDSVGGQEHAFAQTFTAHARTFRFAARFLPASRRQQVTALYAFCRAVDDLADELPPEVGVPALDEWVVWLERAQAGQQPPPVSTDHGGALAGAVLRLRDECGMPVAYLLELVDGARRDATRDSISHFDELRTFCYGTAGTVGLALCYVLGATGEGARWSAERLGIAMQLTNVLRDIGEDFERGRVYLPEDEMQRFGVTREALRRREPDERFAALMQFQIVRARAYYAAAMPGVFLLPRECRMGILLAARLYSAILAQIERQRYDVFSRRAATSTRQKALTAALTYVSLMVPARTTRIPAMDHRAVLIESEPVVL